MGFSISKDIPAPTGECKSHVCALDRVQTKAIIDSLELRLKNLTETADKMRIELALRRIEPYATDVAYEKRLRKELETPII